MQEVTSIGEVPWTHDDIKRAIPEFLELHRRKPISNNQGGMRSPHLFATWFMIRALNPKTVIESGVWKGLGTWLIQQAAPNAVIYSIDIDLKSREYKSNKVSYFDMDFNSIDWSIIQDKKDTVLFFDDHQNAYERLKQGAKLGFKQFIFEDNYPSKRGDCYSLKKVFCKTGFKPEYKGVLRGLKRMLEKGNTHIPPNPEDAENLGRILSIYHEFPPIVKKEKTRWGDFWNNDYPTPDPVFELENEQCPKLFVEEAVYYTWICFAKLNG